MLNIASVAATATRSADPVHICTTTSSRVQLVVMRNRCGSLINLHGKQVGAVCR